MSARVRILARSCALLVAAVAALAPAASARVTLVATGTPELPFIDVSTSNVTARRDERAPDAVDRDTDRALDLDVAQQAVAGQPDHRDAPAAQHDGGPLADAVDRDPRALAVERDRRAQDERLRIEHRQAPPLHDVQRGADGRQFEV